MVREKAQQLSNDDRTWTPRDVERAVFACFHGTDIVESKFDPDSLSPQDSKENGKLPVTPPKPASVSSDDANENELEKKRSSTVSSPRRSKRAKR